MRCPYCGEEMPDGDIFCTKCGARLGSSVEAGAESTLNKQYGGPYGGGSPFPSMDPGQNQGGGFGGGFGSYQSTNNNGWETGENQDDNSCPGSFADPQGEGFASFSNSSSGFSGHPFDSPSGGNGNPFDNSSGSFFQDNTPADNHFDRSAGTSGWDGGPGKDPFGTMDEEPSSAWNQSLGENPNSPGRRGLPRPVMVLLIILAVLLFLIGGLLIANHIGVIRFPFFHSEESGPGSDPDTGSGPAAQEGSAAEEPEKEEEAPLPEGKEEKPEPADTAPAEDTDPADLGTLSMSVTEIEPSELGNYRMVTINGVEAAPGIDGTAPENMISRDNKVWKVAKSTISSGKGNTIRLLFDKCNVKVVEIRAGNWAGAEEYNADSRPTKIYLTMEGYDYPMTLEDVQVPHYIVFSRPVETDELNLKVDSISNGTTGNAALTSITVYEAK